MIGPLSYIGGKRAIASQIIKIFPAHELFCEVFSGGAQVLFRKEPSKVEVLNDLDGDVVNFFRVCQQHSEELIRYLRFTLVSRKWFDLLKATNPTTLTDIQRAARFFYLQKNSFAALVRQAEAAPSPTLATARSFHCVLLRDARRANTF
jgi:DNA adenine methylase